MLFSRAVDRNVMVTKVIFVPGSGFTFTQSHFGGTGTAEKSGFIVGMWRYPTGAYGAVSLMTKFLPRLTTAGYYNLTRDDVWYLYSNWRRAMVSGYDASDIFNVYGVQLPNPLIPSERQLSFDIRLGAGIDMDRRARNCIGAGTAKYSPRPPVY